MSFPSTLSESSPIKVIVRLRPTAHPQGSPSSNFSVRQTSLTVGARTGPAISRNALESHTLDGVVVLPSGSSQEECYTAVAKDLVEGAVVGGVSGCVLAYGQTGSGKTHSMVGALNGSFEGRGIVPRALTHAFNLVDGLSSRGQAQLLQPLDGSAPLQPPPPPTLRLSYVEVLEHGVVDLLARLPDFGAPGSAAAATVQPLSAAAAGAAAAAAAAAASATAAPGAPLPTLSVAEDRSGRTYIPGLLMPRVSSEAEARHLLLEGATNRAIASHALNSASSRSHAVLTLYIEQQQLAEEQPHQPHQPPRYVTVASRLHLVDLAGSERVAKTGAEGARLREANFINKSLSALEAVVLALGEAQLQQGVAGSGSSSGSSGGGGGGSGAAAAAALLAPPRDHVPYRSSRLTHLLKGALGGGKGSTRLLATLWPDEAHSEECIATLRFASRMMCLRTAAVREVVSGRGGALDVEERARLMAAHAAEVGLLRRELALHDALCLRQEGGGGRGSTPHAPLSLGEAQVIEELMHRYLKGEVGGEGGGGGAPLVGGALTTVRHIEEAMSVLRKAVWAARGPGEEGGQQQQQQQQSQQQSQQQQQPPPALLATPAPESREGAGATPGDLLEAWRQTSPEVAVHNEARKAVKELRSRYALAALRVNEAKRAVDGALAEVQQGQAAAAAAAAAGLGGGDSGAQLTYLTTRLVEAKASYRARYEEATAVRTEAEYAQGHADAQAKVVAAAFQAHLAGRKG